MEFLATYQTIQSVAVLQPAIRMTVIAGWAWRDDDTGQLESHVESYPVIGIEISIHHCYSRDMEDVAPEEEDVLEEKYHHEELLEAGWKYVGQMKVRSPLFVDSYGSIISTRDVDSDADDEIETYAVTMTRVCPWSSEHDVVKLAKDMQDIQERARAGLQWSEEHEGNQPLKELKRLEDGYFENEEGPQF